MKNLYLLGALLMCLIGNSQCVTNGDFEGNIAGLNSYAFTTAIKSDTYTDCHIDTQVAGYTALTPSSTLNNIIAGGVGVEGVTLVSNASITPYGVNDPFLFNNGTTGATASIPRVSPSGGGSYAVKLNGSSPNSSVVTMSSNFTPTTSVISFDFSLIFQLHGQDDVEPFFTARIYNSDNEIINLNEICYKANVDNNIFSSLIISGVNTLFTNWQCGRIEIPQIYVGQPLRIEFVVADCGQGGHYGTAYLDNIRCTAACNNPVFGLLTLNQVNVSCPVAPFDVCGDFVAPLNSAIVPGSLQLDLIQNDVIVTNIASVAEISGNTFCFTVDPLQLNVFNGSFEFRVNADFFKPASQNSPAFTYNLFDASASEGFDLTLNSIDITTATVLPGGILSWPDVADTYELQFVSDGLCCPNNTSGADDKYYSTTVTENQLNLGLPLNSLQAKCFRWRIKSNCGGWSDWCCLSGKENYGWPNQFGNPLAPQCYNGNLSCLEDLLADVNLPDSSGEYNSFEQREVSITAVNTLAPQTQAVYQAGRFVELTTGFHAQTGSVLLAEIENCGPAESVIMQKAARIPAIENIDKVNEVANEDMALTVYPNPTDGVVTITSISGINNYTIMDLTGKVLMNFNNIENLNEFTIDISALSPGIYLLYSNGTTTQKIVKK